MPEGPEARVIADQLCDLICGKTINQIEITPIGKLSGNVDNVINHKIEQVKSIGKKIIFEVSDYMIVTSLGMSGRFQTKPGAHSGVIFNLGDLKLYFDDTRHFGGIKIVPKDFNLNLGPDLLECSLTEEISAERWKELLNRQRFGRRAICKILLDQTIVAGIGNYLKSDILYQCRIHPDTKLGVLTDEDLENLRSFSHLIIRSSYLANGLTIQTFLAPDMTMGKFNTFVYNRKTTTTGDRVFKIKSSDGRSSYITEEQILIK